MPSTLRIYPLLSVFTKTTVGITEEPFTSMKTLPFAGLYTIPVVLTSPQFFVSFSKEKT